MPEIDLIPPDYRRAKWLKRWMREMGIISVALICALISLLAVVNVKTDALRQRTAILEKQRAVGTGQRELIESLSTKKDQLNRQLTLLGSLRSGAPAQAVFFAIDRALADAEVWFVDWEFRRAGLIVSEEPAAGVPTGYFIVVPAGTARAKEGDSLVETHMTIRGRARDHEALSRFVNGLFEQQAVVDVSVQRTALQRVAQADLVEFDLTVVLNSETNG